jgi:hypothetical protein
MKLTTEQIDYVFTFTRQHYVEWYFTIRTRGSSRECY